VSSGIMQAQWIRTTGTTKNLGTQGDWHIAQVSQQGYKLSY